MNINNIGYYFEAFFGAGYFDRITTEHSFQQLTESNKPGSSYRRGVYITAVKETDLGTEFNLLRCSTNLSGPTENVGPTDNEIIERVNTVAREYFPECSPLNHVLAQIYDNVVVGGRERKARIKAHSDKTKDMPPNGLLAFCTFYDSEPINEDAMCRLFFKNKLTEESTTVLLRPGSLFLMSLDANRLYTHAVGPSKLNVDRSPTRLGYVIRSSKTRAVFRDGKVYVIEDDNLVELRQPTMDDLKDLKALYYVENSTIGTVNYGNVYFSLNQGDYTEPTVQLQKENVT